MSRETAVYDLGNVDEHRTAVFSAPAGAEGGAGWAPPVRSRRVGASAPLDWTGSLSLFVPGATQIVRGQFAPGFCLLSCMAFLGVLFWALHDSLDRLIGTLGVLGYPREYALWSLAAIFGMGCALHLISVLTRTDEELAGRPVAPHPVIPGIASLLVPGWGQLLNGDRKRAGLFLAGVWTVAAAWILASAPVGQLLETQGFFLPKGLELFASSAVRWTLPAVICTLAVYDAASSAASRS